MIITLIGSARFEGWFHKWNEVLSLSGHLVFGLATYPSNHNGNKGWYTSEEKTILDAVHLGKIDASHAVLLLNPFGYIGSSTLSEWQHAKRREKETYSLQSWGEGCGVDSIAYKQDHIQKAQALQVFPCKSPISVIHDGRSARSVWDLLPPAGNFRRELVARTGSFS